MIIQQCDNSKQYRRQMNTQPFPIPSYLTTPEIPTQTLQKIHKTTKNPQPLPKFLTSYSTLCTPITYNSTPTSSNILSQLHKKHTNIDTLHNDYIHAPIQQIDIVNDDVCFRKEVSENSLKEYVYFKSGNYVYMFNNVFVPRGGNYEVSFVFGELQMGYFLGYVALCIHYGTIVRCLMPECIWEKIKPFFQLFFGPHIYQLLSSENLLIFPQQKVATFDFQLSTILFKKNLWIWDSFDIILSIKGQKYRIVGSGVQDDDIFYTTWRKALITQSQYCKFIDKVIISNMQWVSNSIQSTHKIQGKLNHYLATVAHQFNNFVQCQMFTFINQDVIQELYMSGQILEYNQGQVVYKGLTNLDRVYVLLSGQILAENQQNIDMDNKSKKKIISISEFMFMQSIVLDIKSIRTTLTVISKSAKVYSIPISKFKYILGHYVDRIKQIWNFQKNSITKILEEIGVSEWMQKCTLYDEELSACLSETTTKTVGPFSLKISNSFWRQLCRKKLEILYETQSKSDKNND